jgi:hypothetical protein
MGVFPLTLCGPAYTSVHDLRKFLAQGNQYTTAPQCQQPGACQTLHTQGRDEMRGSQALLPTDRNNRRREAPDHTGRRVPRDVVSVRVLNGNAGLLASSQAQTPDVRWKPSEKRCGEAQGWGLGAWTEVSSDRICLWNFVSLSGNRET